ncbi:MAG: hypothetical protein ACM3JG_16935 [Thiohalocapsa sp.]
MTETMSRYDRLQRWADVLQQRTALNLTPFRDVEWLPRSERDGVRTANSPLALAYQDPVLRRAGLESDRFGDGAAFFGLSRGQAHRILCSCGYFGTMRSTEVARRIRSLAARERLRLLWPDRLQPALARWLSRGFSIQAPERG